MPRFGDGPRIGRASTNVEDHIVIDDAQTLPADMTAIEFVRPGGPEVLVPATRAVPSPGPGEVLIRIHAAGVNGPDVFQRKGLYDPPPGASDIPGLEIAGDVVAVGRDV